MLKDPTSPLPQPVSEEAQDAALLEAVAKRIVDMGMATPAVFFLESTKPLSYIGSQVLVFLEPFVKTLLNLASYNRLVALMEDRRNIEKLMVRIEELDDLARETERKRKEEERAARRNVGGSSPPPSSVWTRLWNRKHQPGSRP